MTIPTEVDIIVVGGNALKILNNVGGAAGCVVASRLAKADPKLQILIIESGKTIGTILLSVHQYFTHITSNQTARQLISIYLNRLHMLPGVPISLQPAASLEVAVVLIL